MTCLFDLPLPNSHREDHASYDEHIWVAEGFILLCPHIVFWFGVSHVFQLFSTSFHSFFSYSTPNCNEWQHLHF